MTIREIGHLAFTCRDLDASIRFYKEVLGLREKFTLYYEDAGRRVEGDQRWIVYMEVGDGSFIELFNGLDASRPAVPGGENYNYQHMALILPDIQAGYRELLEKGAPVDEPPKLGCDGTWQMWSHDPDGNRIEFMQYTDRSYQLKGRL